MKSLSQRSSDALLFLTPLWYNSYTLCDSISMCARATLFGETPSAESASRKYRRFSFILITLTSARIFPVGGRLYSVIFEIRADAEGEFYHLVTLWKATSAERKLYEEHTA
jgi:hypothetical protein